ncbi:hypothetical protein [Pseudodesulfovibrio sediminis]|nr:hypothetical protein [Pseudodesulfovibrio sediminis]
MNGPGLNLEWEEVMPYENEDVRCPVCGRYYDSARMTVDEQGRDICEVCEEAEQIEFIQTDTTNLEKTNE